ncbi:MAG: PorV/PorQ family protein [Flavobacteriales bacterium]|nr:PorV/PorQ family protein [Flavobacteriales bacterium]
MKSLYRLVGAGMLGLAMLTSTTLTAGNPDRAGSAGVGQLLINPWARSSGLASSNMASITGIESQFLNVAGLSSIERTEIAFTNTNYLVGTGISINAVGLGQRVGDAGVIALSVAAMTFGDLEVTTADLPEGGIGNFSPVYANIGVSYCREFSNSITGGITMRILSEAISNVKAQGVSFDAGIRYTTGERDHIKFGISLKNVGPPMQFKGDGLTVTGILANGTSLTVEQRSAKYELPSLVNIGASYDFLLTEKLGLTASGQFTSNSFTYDQFGIGAELQFNEMFYFRGGYLWETDITSSDDSMTAYTGPTAGLSAQINVSESGSKLGLDYSYRVTNPFGGVHSIGIHFDL